MHASALLVNDCSRPPYPRQSPLLRVVKWNVRDHEQESIRVIWEGHAPEVGRIEVSAHIGSRPLPIFCLETGAIVEFQEMSKGVWIPSFDPRPGAALGHSQPLTNLFVIDRDSHFWTKFRNCFELSGWRKTFSRALNDAGQCFSQLRLGNADTVIVGHASEERPNYDLVRTLRQNGFRGRVYGVAEKPRWQGKLLRAGCSAVFSKTAMRELFRSLYRR
jgi:hypothetical protein